MVTPARRQYLAIKERHRDALLLCQVGDFYEAFDDDARVLARDAGVTLTSKEFGRDGRVPLAGVPVRALDVYLRRLVARGHRVAVCEQVSEAGHGLVERAVTRIVTAGTLAEPQLLRERENNYLAALLTGRDGQVALAHVDVSTGEFAVAPFAGADVAAALAAELQRLAPAEVLVPEGAGPYSGPGHATPRDPAAFDPERGAEALRDHFGVRSLEGYGCHDLPLCCGAAAGILDYLREIAPSLLAALAGLRTYHPGDYMTLDGQTRRNLELLRSGREGTGGQGGRDDRNDRGAPRAAGSVGRGLLGVLDRTRTAPGGRLLRRWLGQPLLDLAALAERHDAVTDLVAHPAARAVCRDLFGRMADLERLTGRIRAGTAGPRELLNLRATLGLLPDLRAALDGVEAPLLVRLREALDPCAEVADAIAGAIAGTQEGRRIRPGYDAALDALVTGTQDARRFIAELERRERARTGIKSLKVGYNKVFGYYLEVTRPNLPHVPPDYLRKQTLSACERFITPELKEHEATIADAEGKIAALEAELYAALLRDLGAHAPRQLAVAAAVARLDVLAAFAEVANERDYVRPQLDAGDGLHIRGGRHPTVEAALDRHAFIPNDTALDPDGRMVLLTGPNMAGKSTYLRQVALIVLLAQIGSFVPAEEARIGLVDRIFTRVGAQDDLVAGQSTFMVEMLETAAILHGATRRSLVVLDEIGRGTSTHDGLAIARAVVEELHDRIGCRTLFATHYHELLALLGELPRLRACNVAVREDEDGIVFLHRIEPGGVSRSYGIHVARLAGLPRRVTDRADTILGELEAARPATDPVNQAPLPVAPNGHHHDGSSCPDGSDRSADSADLAVLNSGDFDGVVAEIASLDLVNTTPLEALNRLFAMQRRLRELAALPVLPLRVHRGRGQSS